MNDNIGTTEELIRRLQAGDETSLAPLMTRSKHQLWPLILAESRDYRDAEEILQNTWQAVWVNIGGLQKASSFGGWLRKIAYNACRRYYDNAYHSQGERPYEDDALTWHINRDADVLLREKELKAEAVEAVKHLPSKPEYVRKVAILFYLHDMPLKVIAKQLDLAAACCGQTVICSYFLTHLPKYNEQYHE